MPGPIGVVCNRDVHDHLGEMSRSVISAFLAFALRVFGGEKILVDGADSLDWNHAEVVGPKREHALTRRNFADGEELTQDIVVRRFKAARFRLEVLIEHAAVESLM